MNSVVISKLRAGNITVQEVGLLHYICGHLKDGVFDQPLPQVAIATNLSAPTIHRLLTRLTASGFLKVIRPSVKTKTGNTPVGYKPIQLVEWGGGAAFSRTKPSEPIPNGMIHKESSISVKLVDGDESTLLGNLGIIPPVEWAPDRIVRLTLEQEDRRRQEIERAADYVYLAWGRANRESRILIPKIQPKQLIIPPGAVLCMADDCNQPRVKDGYCEDHQSLVVEAEFARTLEINQIANFEADHDEEKTAEAKALARVNRLGLGYLQQGEEIDGSGPTSYYTDPTGTDCLYPILNVRRPLCECGQRVAYVLDKTGRSTRFWSLGTCYSHRPRCVNCGRFAHASIEWDSFSGRGSVSISSKCLECAQSRECRGREHSRPHGSKLENSPTGSQADYAE